MTDKINVETVDINGVKYIRADMAPKVQAIPGKRAVVVCDRGWIFVGDVTEKNGRISLTRACIIQHWTGGIGFDGLLASGGRGDNVKVKPLSKDVDLPADAELFRSPVEDNWGL